jgi:hypothetical protein
MKFIESRKSRRKKSSTNLQTQVIREVEQEVGYTSKNI